MLNRNETSRKIKSFVEVHSAAIEILGELSANRSEFFIFISKSYDSKDCRYRTNNVLVYNPLYYRDTRTYVQKLQFFYYYSSQYFRGSQYTAILCLSIDRSSLHSNGQLSRYRLYSFHYFINHTIESHKPFLYNNFELYQLD